MTESNSWQSWDLPSLSESRDQAKNQGPPESPQEQVSDEQVYTEAVDQGGSARADEADQSEEIEEIVETLAPEEIKLPSAEELEQLRKAVELEAYQKGFEKGEQHGRESGHQQAYEESKPALEAQISELNQVLAAMTAPVHEQDAAIEQLLLDSVIAIARAVVNRELAAAPEQILTLVRTVMSALPDGQQELRLTLHPEDLALVDRHLKDWQVDYPVRLLADDTIARGGCQAATMNSELDATVARRFNEALAQFLSSGSQPSTREPE